LLFAETPKSKINSPAVFGFPQSDVLFYNCLLWAFAAAASAAEWFFIAAYQSRPVWRGLSAAMKKDILLRVLCASSEAGGDVLLAHLPA
jgi:predicted small integral membrane protein